jgi:mycoredoxin
MAKIRMYTMSSCSDCRAAKRFLTENGVAFEDINIEEVPGAAEVVIQATGGKRTVPTFDIDGSFVTFSPFSRKKLSEALGLSQEA